MKEKNIYLCLAHLGGEEQKYVQEAFDTNWVVPLGPNVDAFEKQIEDFLLSKRSVAAVASGTAAIHLALVLLGVGKDDEVICPTFTFAASANPIVYQGATPIFVDSEADTWNMSPSLLEDAIKDRIRIKGRKPKAIVVVHLYGMPADMEAICEIASRYQIPIVEDSAEAMGSMYGGKLCGMFGDYAVFSFNGNKMITTSGGGALICQNEEQKQRALFFATQAKEPFPYYLHRQIGFNYRMSNVCAGIGRGQMSVLQDHIAHHRKLCALYEDLFRQTEPIALHTDPGDKYQSNYWLNTITIDPKKTKTDPIAVMQHLAEKGIESRPLWNPMHLQPVFKHAPCYINGVSERIYSCGLCIPSGPCVSESDVERIADEIKACL